MTNHKEDVQDTYFREMPTTERLKDRISIPSEAQLNMESPDPKEMVGEEEINPSSNKKKNLLNESTDEEDKKRRR